MDITPILKDLTEDQFKILQSICVKEEFPPFTVILKEGDQPTHLYILTEGVLRVTLRGDEIGQIEPVSTVGEMGVFTEEERSARITTVTDCTLLKIRKKDLFDLFEEDKDLYIKFQKAMIADIAQKLRMSNETITRQNRYISKIEKKTDYYNGLS